MEKGQIDYPLSTNYRKEWGDWEAIREIMQNAFDSDAKIETDFNGNVLTIRDYGEGLSLRHLLIGESEKDGVETIGKFGEGLKFAFLTLLRQDKNVIVYSNGLILKPILTEMFGAQTMRINYESAPEPIKGTEVHVEGITDSFEDRFLSLNKEENFISRPLLDRPGKLYIKGIYVKEIKAITGYNLKIERENPLSGSVDSWRVLNAMEELITKTSDREYISKLLMAVNTMPKADFDEYACGSWHDVWMKDNPEIWSDVIEQIFGKKVCLSTNPPLSREAEYRGFRVLDCMAHFLKGTIKTDLEVIMEDNRDDFYEYSFESLSDQEKENLIRVSWLIYKSHYVEVPIQIVDFKDNPNTSGASIHRKWIRIAYKIVADFRQLYSTVLHEFIHYYFGYADFAPEFQSSLGDAHSRIVSFLNGDKVDVPSWYKPFSEENKNEQQQS